MSTRRQLNYFHNLGIALTRTLAALIGVDYRVSFSAQCWAWEASGKLRGKLLRPTVDVLFFWDANHCRESYYREISAIEKLEKIGL